MVDISTGYCIPKVYGKDETLVQIIMYGQTTSPDMIDVGLCHDYDDSDVVQKQLREMGVYIN